MRLEYSTRQLQCVWVLFNNGSQRCTLQATYTSASTKLFLDVRQLDCVWNVMAHAQKQDFVFRRNGRVHLNRRGRQFSRLLTAEVCASAVVMLDTPCSEVVWRVLTTHSIRQFPPHFPARASPCAITFQLDSTVYWAIKEASKYTLKMKSGSKRMNFPSIKMTALLTSKFTQRARRLYAVNFY